MATPTDIERSSFNTDLRRLRYLAATAICQLEGETKITIEFNTTITEITQRVKLIVDRINAIVLTSHTGSLQP